jgi:hypothetical protein
MLRLMTSFLVHFEVLTNTRNFLIGYYILWVKYDECNKSLVLINNVAA